MRGSTTSESWQNRTGQEAEVHAKAERLERELNAIRQSRAYKVGCWVEQAAAAPVRKGVPLAWKALRMLGKRVISRPKSRKRLQHGQGVSSQKEYVNPGLETHRYVRFSGAEARASQPSSSFRLGLICGSRLLTCLEHHAVCSLVPKKDWEGYLSEARPEMVLIESAIDTASREWEALLTSPEGAAQIWEFARLCQTKGVPLVFWHTTDTANAPLFVQVAGACERIYAVDRAGCNVFQAAHPDVPCQVLPVAVSPQLHNPFQPGSWGKDLQDLTFVYNGWSDLLEYPGILTEILGSLRQDGLHVIDSAWRFMARKLDDLPEWREHIMGCLNYRELVSVLKAYPVSLMPGSTLSSQATRTRRAMEALCCGSAVVADKSLELPQDLHIPDSALVRAKDNEFADKARQVLRDEHARLKGVHVARRALLSAHTYGHRLNRIQADLGLAPSWEEAPLISVVMPTKRPQNIEQSLAKFQAQTYERKELIVVLNRSEAQAREKIMNLIQDLSNVKLLVLHQEMNIGSCLNTAIKSSRGQLWFKMDDDDFYGPNYIQDMVHAWHCTGADILGKTPGFVYLQAEDALYMRRQAKHSNILCDSLSPHMCGATISGQRKSIDLVSFGMDERSCVDSNFFFHSLQAGLRVCLADPYNFVVFRSANQGDHTWKFTDELIRKESIKISEEMDFSQVMI